MSETLLPTPGPKAAPAADASVPASEKASAPPRKLLAGDFAETAVHHNRWSAHLSEGFTLEDVTKEVFWANIAPKLRPGDIIEIRKNDNSLYAELYVRACDAAWANVSVMGDHPMGPADDVVPANVPFDVKWTAGKQCFEVIRRLDRQVVHSGFALRERAVEWIRDHLKAMAA